MLVIIDTREMIIIHDSHETGRHRVRFTSRERFLARVKHILDTDKTSTIFYDGQQIQ